MNKRKKGRVKFILLLLSFLFVALLIKHFQEESWVQVPYALQEIPPRTQVTEDMIGWKELPSSCVDDSFVLKVDEIVQRYSDIQGKIFAGSFFYKGMLKLEQDLPDQPSLMLKGNQSVYSLAVDLVSLSGNTILPGQMVDVHVTIDHSGTAPVADCLLKGVRVLKVKDRMGKDMAESESSIPAVILLAIDNSVISYLKIAEKIGEVEVMASSITYDRSQECILNQESAVLRYLGKE